jgi:EcsC protein family
MAVAVLGAAGAVPHDACREMIMLGELALNTSALWQRRQLVHPWHGGASGVVLMCGGPMASDQHGQAMTPYDRQAWAQLEQWRAKRLSTRTRRIVPRQLRDRVHDLGQTAKDGFEAVPGAADFEKVFLKSLEGLLGLGSRAAIATVPKASVIGAYCKRGHPVDDLEDIRKIDLASIDQVKPRLGLRYTAAATVEGAGAAFVVSGGELLAATGTVFGVGAGAAPGAATVMAAIAADAAAVLLAAHRAVAHTAAYYGYDVEKPDEQVFMLGVLGLGTASEAGKVAAYAEINKLVQQLARSATWERLNESVVTKVVQKVFTRLGFRLTQRKLGQAVPVIGIAIGAGMNAQLLQRITDDADHLYRERLLRDRYGLDFTTVDAADAVGDELDITEIIDAEIVGDDPSPAANNHEADEDTT